MDGPAFFISYAPSDERWATWITWELENAGYSTVVQAWDFAPGTNFIDFVDRGVKGAALVISVLSRNYLTSRYGRLEWQAALRADPSDATRLVMIRLEDCPLEGILSMFTPLDLVGVTDAKVARARLLARARALAGRVESSNQLSDLPDRHERAARIPVIAPEFPMASDPITET